ncbi:MAG TPA: hypothetical protein VNQ73_01260 [Ilumatobacter sp.]|nr:hypothetical protein [Ilumatobacter sp.]
MTDAPVAQNNRVTSSTPTAPIPPPSASASEQTTTVPVVDDPAASEDAVLLASLYSLLGVGTPQEQVILFSTNVSEDEIATCMADAGFQYVEDPSLDPEAMAAMDQRNSMSADEYANRYGLGITGWDLGLFPSPPADPNSAYSESLSQGQRDAYNQSHGVCAGRFDRERRAHSDALNVALDTFRDVVTADDRVVAALGAWQSCMAASGFDYETPQAMQSSFYARMSAGAGRAELEQLHAEEVTVAIANVPCEAAYTAAYRDVVGARFGEFKSRYETALATGAAPEAAG